MTKELWKHIDIPAGHFSNEALRFISPRTHDPVEAERRHGRGTGVIAIEGQYRGARMVIRTLEQLVGDALIEGANTFKICYLGSAALSLENTANTQRSDASIPQFARQEDDWRIDGAAAQALTFEQLGSCEMTTGNFYISAATRDPKRLRAARQAGRSLADAGMLLANVGWADMARWHKAVDVQDIARNECLAAMDEARQIGRQIGAYPTLAQLAHRFSPFSVHLANNAPDEVYTAFRAAQAEFAFPD